MRYISVIYYILLLTTAFHSSAYSNAHASEISVSGILSKGAPCYIVTDRSGNQYSIRGQKINRNMLGKRVKISGKKLRISNCMQGTTLQVTKIAPLD